jgi:hypothetical protein
MLALAVSAEFDCRWLPNIHFHRARHFLPQTVDTTKASRHKATRKLPLEKEIQQLVLQSA